jgi:hypothetical protein
MSDDLNCCVGQKPEHAVQDPVIGVCGHFVCSSCANDGHETCCVQSDQTSGANIAEQTLNFKTARYVEANMAGVSQLLMNKLSETVQNIKSIS